MTGQDKAKTLAKRILGWAASVILFVWLAAKFVLDWVGRSTAPDAFQQLLDKMPGMLEWSYQTPWYVPATLAAIVSGAVIWLNRPQMRVSTLSFDEAARLGIPIPPSAVSPPNTALRASVKLHFRENDATPELVSEENLFRYYAFTDFAYSRPQESAPIQMNTRTALWIVYNLPVLHSNVRVRVPSGILYEIKDASPRHTLVFLSPMPSNATVEVETY